MNETDIAWQNFINNKDFMKIESDKNYSCTRQETPKPPNPTPIYISTQTKIAYLNQQFDLNKLFWLIPIIPYYEYHKGIIKKQMKLVCSK